MGLAAGGQVVLDEGGRIRGRPEDLLELPGICVDLPDALDRGGELGGDDDGAGVEVVGDVGDGHGITPGWLGLGFRVR